MNRTPMQRRTPLRSKAPPPRPARQWEGPAPVVAPVRATLRSDGAARMVVQVPKEDALQHQGYMDIVRRMHCAHCGRPGPSQFCHSDEGKGMSIKTDCRRGWPGCADGPGRIGCHTLLGSTGKFTREVRRLLEDGHASRTRAQIMHEGLWPAGLPQWEDDKEGAR